MINTIKLFLLFVLFCWLPSTVCIAEVTYYHTDNLGTPMAMTDSTGKVVWQGDFYPFGEEYQIQATPNKNKRRFAGKEKDEESGLHYFGARYMDEISGRFVSPDPVTAVDAQTSKTNTALLANPLRLNRYVYGLNNPYRYIDPDGNFAVRLLILAESAYIKAAPYVNRAASATSRYAQKGYRAAKGLFKKPASKGATNAAHNTTNGLNLNKSLASQTQMGEAGKIMAGPGGRVKFRDAGRVAKQYGGNASDWAKKRSSDYAARDGAKFRTHWVENIKTGQRIEFKTKLIGGQ